LKKCFLNNLLILFKNMRSTFKSVLFKLDFLGIIPQLKIFNNKIYKSMFSSIFSIIIIIFSVTFGIYSFLEFIKQNPMIDYYKTNDFTTNKTIEISDSFIMFRINGLDCGNEIRTNLSFYSFYYSSENNFSISLIVEPCLYGKNIDLKYQELIENFEKKESISQYYCINFNDINISFFHHPNNSNKVGNYIGLTIKSNDFDCNVKSFSLNIISYICQKRLEFFIRSFIIVII